MIVVDDRIGSAEIAPLLRLLQVPCSVERLEAADFAFDGEGYRGRCSVGVERKKLRELLQSIESGRFEGDQLPKMLQHYGDQCWLLVEGVWRPHPQSGVLEEAVRGGWREVMFGTRGWAYCQLDNFLTSLQARCRVKVKQSHSPEHTAHVVKGLWQWYQKPWEAHKTGLVIYSPPPPAALWFKPTLVRRVAKELDGIGWHRSGAVDSRFGSVLDMVVAPEGEWEHIPGIGKGIASRVVRQLLGQEK